MAKPLLAIADSRAVRPLTPTHAECHECDSGLWPLDPEDLDLISEGDGCEVLCPHDAGHAVEFSCVSNEPLSGNSAVDQDYFNHGAECYEYTLVHE